MESHLPAFKDGNPQLEVVTELIRGQHPHLKAFYSKFNFFYYYFSFIFFFFEILLLSIFLFIDVNASNL